MILPNIWKQKKVPNHQSAIITIITIIIIIVTNIYVYIYTYITDYYHYYFHIVWILPSFYGSLEYSGYFCYQVSDSHNY